MLEPRPALRLCLGPEEGAGLTLRVGLESEFGSAMQGQVWAVGLLLFFLLLNKVPAFEQPQGSFQIRPTL